MYLVYDHRCLELRDRKEEKTRSLFLPLLNTSWHAHRSCHLWTVYQLPLLYSYSLVHALSILSSSSFSFCLAQLIDISSFFTIYFLVFPFLFPSSPFSSPILSPLIISHKHHHSISHQPRCHLGLTNPCSDFCGSLTVGNSILLPISNIPTNHYSAEFYYSTQHGPASFCPLLICRCPSSSSPCPGSSTTHRSSFFFFSFSHSPQGLLSVLFPPYALQLCSSTYHCR